MDWLSRHPAVMDYGCAAVFVVLAWGVDGGTPVTVAMFFLGVVLSHLKRHEYLTKKELADLRKRLSTFEKEMAPIEMVSRVADRFADDVERLERQRG